MTAPAAPLPVAPRVPLLALGGAALVTGLWAGLARLGAVSGGPALPVDHGPLMVSGFLGTVIALERAVAARTPWAHGAPAACGAGAAALIGGQPFAGALLLTAGSAAVAGLLLRVLWRDRALHHVVLAAAALAWLGGNLALASGHPPHRAVPAWVVFLVGTIAAERLELNRLLPRTGATVAAFLAAAGLLAFGAALAWPLPDAGTRVQGAGALGLAAWLGAHDVARRTVRHPGATRYIAVALLAGYAWLAVGGALALAFGDLWAGPRYDALLHALFVGFVFSMIFGHALVILPAILGVRVDFRGRFYAHLALLHASLAVRVAADLLGLEAARRASAWANVLAIALFLGSTAAAARRGPSRAP